MLHHPEPSFRIRRGAVERELPVDPEEGRLHHLEEVVVELVLRELVDPRDDLELEDDGLTVGMEHEGQASSTLATVDREDFFQAGFGESRDQVAEEIFGKHVEERC